MKCPNCHRKLPYYSGNKVICRRCHSELRAVNGLVVNSVLFIVFALTIKLLIINEFDENMFLGVFYLIGGAVLFQGLRNFFVEYECVGIRDEKGFDE